MIVGRTKICDLAEIAWIHAIEPDSWISAEKFEARLFSESPWTADESWRRRFFLAIKAAKALDWPLERRRAASGEGLAGNEVEIKPLSTGRVLDAHLAALYAGTLYEGFGRALAILAVRYPYARIEGDPLDRRAIEAGVRALKHPRAHDATAIVHEALLGRMTLREDGRVMGIWLKEGVR